MIPASLLVKSPPALAGHAQATADAGAPAEMTVGRR